MNIGEKIKVSKITELDFFKSILINSAFSVLITSNEQNIYVDNYSQINGSKIGVFT